MGLVGTVIKSVVNDFIEITSEVLAPKFNKVSRFVGTPGIVGIPLKDDDCIIVQIGDDLTKTVFIGTFQNQDIEPGEAMIYSRDSDGNVIAKVLCNKDGDTIIENDNGFAKLLANGQWNVNDNLTVDP